MGAQCLALSNRDGQSPQSVTQAQGDRRRHKPKSLDPVAVVWLQQHPEGCFLVLEMFVEIIKLISAVVIFYTTCEFPFEL